MNCVIDVGCGNGGSLGEIPEKDFVIGVDFNFNSLQEAKALFPRAHFVAALSDALPFRENSFDCAICRVALPYMNIHAALAEISRVLAPGGGWSCSFIHSVSRLRISSGVCGQAT